MVLRKTNYMLCMVCLFTVFAWTGAHAQSADDVVDWSAKVQPGRAFKPGEQANAVVEANIVLGWHVYAITQAKGGPIATTIVIPTGQALHANGAVTGTPPMEAFDKNFGMITEFYESSADFVVPFSVDTKVRPGSVKAVIKVTFEACNEERCLPLSTAHVPITVTITSIGSADKKSTEKTESKFNNLSRTGLERRSQDNKPLPTYAKFLFTDFMGKSREFSEFKGKVVLLDFWATWCRPCLADIPKLKSLYDKYNANGFEIIGMDSETIGDEADAPDPEFAKETAERAKQIVATRGIVWTQATSDTAVPVAMKVFGVKSLPTKILIDREGHIVATIGEKDDLVAVVEKYLNANK